MFRKIKCRYYLQNTIYRLVVPGGGEGSLRTSFMNVARFQDCFGHWDLQKLFCHQHDQHEMMRHSYRCNSRKSTGGQSRGERSARLIIPWSGGVASLSRSVKSGCMHLMGKPQTTVAIFCQGFFHNRVIWSCYTFHIKQQYMKRPGNIPSSTLCYFF